VVYCSFSIRFILLLTFERSWPKITVKTAVLRIFRSCSSAVVWDIFIKIFGNMTNIRLPEVILPLHIWLSRRLPGGGLTRWVFSSWLAFYLSPVHTADADATELSSCVASASAVWTQFATSSRRLPTDSVDHFETEHSSLTMWILVDIDKFSNNDVTVSSLVTNLSSSTAQEIVN